jgi:hypothetical protein
MNKTPASAAAEPKKASQGGKPGTQATAAADEEEEKESTLLDPNHCIVDPGPTEVKEVEMDFWNLFKVADKMTLVNTG